jgi:hypothetical protein
MIDGASNPQLYQLKTFIEGMFVDRSSPWRPA